MGRAALLSGLESLGLGDRLLTNPAALAAFGSDALTAFHQRPVAVVVAACEDDVVQTVRLCHSEGVPFVARGSGTSLSGGSVPVEDGIVIALNRLDRVVRIDADARTAVVQPGTINLDVSAAAAPHGLAYAPDPS
ncbi:MAG: FAD-binding protein, partial [Actinomycetota bacterium]|nr:FAD-binding protein [Actinomycetota bacterium]